jgi:hypothetical protein
MVSRSFSAFNAAAGLSLRRHETSSRDSRAPFLYLLFFCINQGTKGNAMSLQEALQEFKNGVVARLPAEDVALMDKATEDLIRSGIAVRAKKVGEKAPDFTLPNTSGEMVKLFALLARGSVVVTFYRGTW